MTREEAKKLLPIIQAFAEGKTIQYKFSEGWRDLDELTALSDMSKYRVKPEPKYRPFKNQEECWNEMLKHQPFGWLREKVNKKEMIHIDHVFDASEDILITSSITKGHNYSSSYFFLVYTFADGTPFGIKEE